MLVWFDTNSSIHWAALSNHPLLRLRRRRGCEAGQACGSPATGMLARRKAAADARRIRATSEGKLGQNKASKATMEFETAIPRVANHWLEVRTLDLRPVTMSTPRSRWSASCPSCGTPNRG